MACGQGRHAHLLAEAGFDVTGLDRSAYLVDLARERGTSHRLRYRRGDMRRLPVSWTARFDAVINLFNSFGFFSAAADDVRAIAQVARVLAPGGTFIWHGTNRDSIAARFLSRDWWENADGTVVTQQRAFDPLSGILRVKVSLRKRAEVHRRAYRIRLYNASSVASMLLQHGVSPRAGYDGFSRTRLRCSSAEMLIVSRRK